MTTVWVSAVKSSVVAEDGRAITVTIDARNVGEPSLLIQAESIDDFISSLSKARSILQAKERKPDQVAVKMPNSWLVACDPLVL
jgi:hypothetical protein